MIDPKNIAIISCIDTNKKVVIENYNTTYRYFEYEALRCYTSWRKNGGIYKDINIYCLNSKGPIISNKTLFELKKLNVTYIDDYNAYIAKNEIEFIDKLYAQQYFEKTNRIHEKYLIYMDLDVYILKNFPEYIYNVLENNKILLAKHDKVDEKFDKDFLNRYVNITTKLNGNCYNAYLVMENKTNKFFTILYDLIHSKKYKKFYDEFALLREPGKKDDYYLYEETLYDYQWYMNIFNKNIYNLNISEIENIYFKHHHMTIKDILPFIK